MPKTASTMLALGTVAPAFELPDVVTEKTISLNNLNSAKALLVIFASPHCPFVKHIQQGFAQLDRDFSSQGLSIVGTSGSFASNIAIL